MLITAEELKALYESVCGANADAVGAIDIHKIERIARLPDRREGGLPVYPTLFAKVAALVQGLLREEPHHPLDDKVALYCMKRVLEQNGYELHASTQAVEQLLAGVRFGITRTNRISLWLKQHTRRRAERPTY